MGRTKTRAKKSSAPRKRSQAELPVSPRLNERQEKLKKIVIATHGLLDVSGAAEALGVHRATVWEDLRMVRAASEPRDLEGWNEDESIRGTIEFYDMAIALLVGEMRAVQEFEAAKQEEAKRRTGERVSKIYGIQNTVNLKLGIMNTISIYRRDLSNFLITIGLIREAPKRLLLEHDDQAGLATTEEIDEAIGEIRSQVDSLRSAYAAATAPKKKPARKKATKKKATKKKATRKKAGAK